MKIVSVHWVANTGIYIDKIAMCTSEPCSHKEAYVCNLGETQTTTCNKDADLSYL